MRNVFENVLSEAEKITSPVEKVVFANSIVRSILQCAVVTSLEIARAKTPYDEMEISELTERLRRPNDGLPVQILDRVIPFLREYYHPDFYKGWFVGNSSTDLSLCKILQEWVEFRNSRPGHGVLDVETAKEWEVKVFALSRQCLEVFGACLPEVSESEMVVRFDGDEIPISTPLISGGMPVVILAVLERRGVWKMRAQVLSNHESREFTVALATDNVFSLLSSVSNEKFKIVDVNSGDKQISFYHNLPNPQTDTFEGRSEEIASLIEWLSDEDSRFCLVFGDGGYGKTTLVLEVLGRIVDGSIDVPRDFHEIVCFYSAKKTRWTEEGIVHYRGVSAAVEESIRELVRLFRPRLNSEWFKVSGEALVSKAAGVMAENGYKRDDVLLILDNTETLAESTDAIKELGSFFKSVGKRLAKVVITSRRREFIEASPIEVAGLSQAECVALMRRIAKDYNAEAILKAGDSRLGRVADQLSNKPLLIEGLVKHISHTCVGIDAAIDSVFGKTNTELLEFLYEDAWVRMTDLQKNIFMVISGVSVPIDSVSVSKSCQEIGMQHSEFQAGLSETYFASVTDYHGKYSLELVDLAKRFFESKRGRLSSSERDVIARSIENVDNHWLKMKEAECEYGSDRVAHAFRSDFAKAAKVSAKKGRISEADEYYKLAIEEEPLNSALHDRYAWFKANLDGDLDAAGKLALKALELDPNNSDAMVNMAVINYRNEGVAEGDKYIDMAIEKGRSVTSCLIRKAAARYHAAKKTDQLDWGVKILEEGMAYLNLAERENKVDEPYYEKSRKDINKYRSLSIPLLRSLKARHTHKAHSRAAIN